MKTIFQMSGVEEWLRASGIAKALIDGLTNENVLIAIAAWDILRTTGNDKLIEVAQAALTEAIADREPSKKPKD